jgi:hypothetical protein
MTRAQVRKLESRRFLRRWDVAGVLVAGALLAPAVATADPAPSSATSPRAQYRQAHDAMNAKHWDDALRLLLDLWTQSHTYDVASDLMFVEYHLGNYAAAANYGQFAVRNVPPVADPDESARLRKGLDEVKKRVGAISVSVDRAGAEVRVDATVVGQSPLPSDVYVDVGPHRVSASLGGAVSPESRVDALAGESYKVELALPPAGSSQSPRPQPALETSTSPPDFPERTPSYAPAVVAASVGGVALVGGIVALVVSINQHADAQDRLHQLGDPNACGAGMSAENAAACQEIASQADSSHALRTLSFVGFGTAVAAGAVSYVLWPKSGSRAARLEPRLDVAHHGFFAALGYHF